MYEGRYAEAEALLKEDVAQGQATAISWTTFLPSATLAPVRSWLARAQEGLGLNAAAAESYRAS